MHSDKQDTVNQKEALKKLRERRKTDIQAATARMKAQKKTIRAIKAQLLQGAQAVPELAAATGDAPAQTLWYLAALKKYGEIREAEKEGNYYKYALIQKEGAKASD